MLSLPSPFKELGEKTQMISSMDEYDNITKHEVLKMGSLILLFTPIKICHTYRAATPCWLLVACTASIYSGQGRRTPTGTGPRRQYLAFPKIMVIWPTKSGL